MIARIWNGRTRAAKGEEYKAFLLEVAVPDYKSVNSLIEINFLYRVEGDVAFFKLITLWPSIDEVIKFAGRDFEKAKYYEADKEFLLEFEEKVIHYDVFFKS